MYDDAMIDPRAFESSDHYLREQEWARQAREQECAA